MNYKNKSFVTKKNAFTLIELLIVIAIIGVLFIVLVSKVDFATDKAKATGVQTDFRSFQIAFEQVAKENSGFNTFGWDTGDTNGDRVRNSYDVGDINKDGVQDSGETWTGRKAYSEEWTGIYTLVKPGTNVYDAEVIAKLETAINANLDPKLHITISPEGLITMANGAQDPWKNEYHGRYLSNAGADKLDRGAIIMYSDGSNGVNGSADGIAGGLVNITTPGSNVDGKDDYALATVYTYANGYGEVKSITYGFSNNQSFDDASDVPVIPVGQAPSVVVPTPGDSVEPDDETVVLPTENPSGDLQDYFNDGGWSAIKNLANARLTKTEYHNKYGIEPGDTIVSNGITYILVDLGLDNDGNGTIDEEEQKGYDGFVFMYNSKTTSKLNSTMINQGGYVSTNVGKTYVDSLYTNLEDDGPNGLKANIKKVTITCNSGDVNADGTDDNGMSAYTTEAYMFLASSKEVGFKFSGYQYTAEGAKFDLFVNETARANFATLANIASKWWLRSAASVYTYSFYAVFTDGGSVTSTADTECVVVPAFVIG